MSIRSTFDFINLVKNHRIPLDPNKRYIGVRDNLIGWALLAATAVFFKVPSGLIPTELNFFVQFSSGAVVILFSVIIYGIFQGMGLKGYQILNIQGTQALIGRGILNENQRFLLIYIRGSIASVGYMSYEFAKEAMGIIDTSAIQVTLLAFFLLRQHFDLREWIGVLIAVIGVTSILYFNAQGSTQVEALWGYAFGVASAAILMIIIIMTSIIIQHDYPVRMAFHQCLCGVILTLIILAFSKEDISFAGFSYLDLGNAMASGICYAGAILFFFRAFLFAEPFVNAITGYSLVLYVAIFQSILHKELVSFEDVISSVLIAVGYGIFMLQEFSQVKKKSSLEKALDSSRSLYKKRKKTDLLKELEMRFDLGDINKFDYISEMYEKEKIIFDLADFIKMTPVRKIIIKKDSVSFQIEPHQLQIDNSARSAPLEFLNFGSYEAEEIAMVFNFIHEEGVIFDVGAHLGWYSLVLAKKFPKSKIFAFEPVEPTYQVLENNIKNNGLANVTPVHLGLSDSKGEAFFYYSELGSTLSSQENVLNFDTYNRMQCNLIRLDDFISSETIEKITLIKCDTVGNDFFVLKGAKKSLQKFNPILMLELVELWCQRFGYSGNEIIEYLKNLGYDCFLVQRDKLKKVDSIDIENVDKFHYFFLHTKKHKQLIDKFALIG